MRVGLALGRIIAVVGVAGATALVERYGGREIRVPAPEHLEPGHPLAQTLGLDLARAFAARFEGPRFLVPLGTGWGSGLPHDAAALIHDLIERGASTAVIVQRARCHARTVERYRRRRRSRAG
jgi:hypothetical protein